MPHIKYTLDFDNPSSSRLITLPDRPPATDIEPPVGPDWTGPLPLDDLQSRRWRGYAGTFIAENIGLDVSRAWHLADWPPGYSLWKKKRTKQQIDGTRHDWYLVGFGGASKFDSPPAFAFHAVWLYHDEYHDFGRCVCVLHNPGTKQGEITEKWLGIPMQNRRPPQRRSGESSAPQSMRSMPVLHKTDRKRLFTWHLRKDPILKEWQRANGVISVQRDHELSSQRPYRVGELVWVSCPPLQPHDPLPNEIIDLWPALVAEVQLRSVVTSQSQTPFMTEHTWRYKVALSGVGNSVVVDEASILPWHTYKLPRSVVAKMSTPPLPAELTPDLVEIEPFQPIPDPSPPGESDRAVPPRTYQNALAPIAIGYSVSRELAKLCTVCEPYTDTRKTPNPHYYQGIWFGPERIWIHDLVRLRFSRRELEEGFEEGLGEGRKLALLEPSPNSETRVIFGQIVEIEMGERNELNFTTRLYDLAEEDTIPDSEEEDDPLPQPASLSFHAKARDQSYPLPAAPLGYRFRQISKRGKPLYLPVSAIAGRYYPGIARPEGPLDLLTRLVNQESIAEVVRQQHDKEEGRRHEMDDADRDASEIVKRVMHVIGLQGGHWPVPRPMFGDAQDRQMAAFEAQNSATKKLYDLWMIRRDDAAALERVRAKRTSGGNFNGMDED